LPSELPKLSDTEIELKPNGTAVIETYTVDFGRDGKPTTGYVVGRMQGSGKRFISTHGDEHTLMELISVSKEPIGRKGQVRAEEDGNRFVIDPSPHV